MGATWSRVDNGSEWNAAVDLVHRVAAGSDLPDLASPVLLDNDKVLHVDLTAQGWRYHTADITYVAPRSVAICGPLMFGLVAASTAAARRRTR